MTRSSGSSLRTTRGCAICCSRSFRRFPRSEPATADRLFRARGSRSELRPYHRGMPNPNLVEVQVRFKTEEDVSQLSDRIREAVTMIVGRDDLEDFRVRTIPLP